MFHNSAGGYGDMTGVGYGMGGAGAAQAPVYVPPSRAIAPAQYGHGHGHGHFVGSNAVQNPWHHTAEGYGKLHFNTYYCVHPTRLKTAESQWGMASSVTVGILWGEAGNGGWPRKSFLCLHIII